MGLFERIHVHVPYPALREHLPLLTGHGLSPEIYLPKSSLAGLLSGGGAEDARRVREAGLSASVHGPFADLSPGAVDAGFRDLTRERMRDALRGAARFAASHVVFHPGYDPLRFRDHAQLWLRNSLRTWNGLLPLPEGLAGCWIAIENIFEDGPSTLAALMERLPSPPFGFCLDTGHFQMFSKEPLEAWFDALGPRLREVHLHDNGGDSDEHLPPGAGIFDFERLYRLVGRLGHPVLGTLEMHRVPHIFEGLDHLRSHGVL